MDGILLIDKPSGMSSFAVVRQVKKIFETKKVGHAGTLDPLATGLLIVVLGRYTKFAELLTGAEKKYIAEIELGSSTTTDDREGELLFRKPYGHITLDEVSLILKKFEGEIYQTPPKFSAIKYQGQRAYSLARKEKEVILSPRKVQIKKLELKNFTPPIFGIEVHCSKGTYIRSLARDIGEALGVGGFAKSIRRISSGEFSITDAKKLDELDQKREYLLKTGDSALLGIKKIFINCDDARKLARGQCVSISSPYSEEKAVAFLETEPIAIVNIASGFLKPLRVI